MKKEVHENDTFQGFGEISAAFKQTKETFQDPSHIPLALQLTPGDDILHVTIHISTSFLQQRAKCPVLQEQLCVIERVSGCNQFHSH